MTSSSAASGSLNASRLELLYRVSQSFNSSLDLDDVLNRVIDEVVNTTHAERGFLMLTDPTGGLVFHVARGIDHATIHAPASQVSWGVIEQVATKGQPLLTSNAQDDTRLNERVSVFLLGLRAVLCVPLLYNQQTVGVIYVDNRIQTGIFTPADLEMLNSIAASAAVAIENARLYQVAVEKGRLDRELQLARNVQTSLLPHKPPSVPGWDFAARWTPAREVAGDFYDFLQISPDCLGLIIADVSDKGMPAALYMALTRSLVRASTRYTATPAEAIAQANQLICGDSAYGMFVTLFFARLNCTTGELTYVNAGHNPPLLFSQSTGAILRLTRTGIALGVVDDAEYEQRSIRISPGDSILFYTDGLTEAHGSDGEDFGETRLTDLFHKGQALPADTLITALLSAIETYAQTTAPADDMTVFVVKRLD